jgi:transcriptional regulator with XRE-family HTH domain
MPPRDRSEDEQARLRRFARNAKAFRTQLGKKMTRALAAQLAGISPDVINKWERAPEAKSPGARAPDALTLAKLAPVYGRNSDDFWKENPGLPDPELMTVFALVVNPGVRVDDALLAEGRAFVDDLNRRHQTQVEQGSQQTETRRGSRVGPRSTRPARHHD